MSPVDSHHLQYDQKSGRNDIPAVFLERKLQERNSSLIPFVTPKIRIAEIGCAEGELGHRLKQQVHPLEYWGVEPSKDARIASTVLDNVVPSSEELINACGKESFDILLAFHVLEHIKDITHELRIWKKLLRSNGAIIVEVPNGSGNRLVTNDLNIEHLHFFSVSSICLLAHKNGFEVSSISTGHFESPAYSDCIRAVLRIPLTPLAKERIFLEKVNQKIGRQFSIFGIGGDFRSYLMPVIDQLPILGLIDSDQNLHGVKVCGHTVVRYNLEKHKDQPILVTSIRYEQQISDALAAMHHLPSSIFKLSSLLE